MLGHTEVVLKSDGEPTMLGLQTRIQDTRARLGLKTQLQQAPKGDHRANGMVEQTVQVSRLHAGVLLEQYEQNTGCVVPTEHPLHSWCFRHAAWVLNRFNPLNAKRVRRKDCLFRGDGDGASEVDHQRQGRLA